MSQICTDKVGYQQCYPDGLQQYLNRILYGLKLSSLTLMTCSIFAIMLCMFIAWFLSMSSWRTSGSYCPVSWRLLKRFLEVTLPGWDMVGLVEGF